MNEKLPKITIVYLKCVSWRYNLEWRSISTNTVLDYLSKVGTKTKFINANFLERLVKILMTRSLNFDGSLEYRTHLMEKKNYEMKAHFLTAVYMGIKRPQKVISYITTTL